MRLATRRFVRDDGSSPSNYGYTFWIHDDWEGVPEDTFASRGFNVNDCYVVPSLELVVARLGNQNPPRGQRSVFTKTILQKIVAAIETA
jgi:CubicO group peptidase (beta-lactamase class C family)